MFLSEDFRGGIAKGLEPDSGFVSCCFLEFERERERERERTKVSTQRKSVSCGAFILVHVVVVVTNASAITREYRKRDFPVFGGSKMRHKTTTTLVKFSHLNAPLQRPYRLVLHC